jgi:hypothetical protein
VLYDLKHEITYLLRHRFELVEYEEKLLYNMASNSEIFGTAMFRYNEKQLYKKFLKVMKIPPLGRLDFSLMNDMKFNARFLAMLTAKMKK